MNDNKKRIIVFTITAFAAAWLLTAMIPLTGHIYGDMISMLILAVCMFMPSLANVLTRLITKEGFHDLKLWPHFKGNFKYYLFSYLVIPIFMVAGLFIFFLIFRDNLDIKASAVMSTMHSQGVEISLWVYVLFSMLIAPIVNIVPTLGEEFGWRGYLIFKLKEEYGSQKATIFTGIIWGLWHMPMIALGHNYGTNYPGYPILGILMMTLMCVVVGTIEGYATLKTDSAIPAAMIHSALNALASLGMMFYVGTPNLLLGPTFVGIIVMIPAMILNVILLMGMKKKQADR